MAITTHHTGRLRGSHSSVGRSQRRRSLTLESLEGRSLLSASPTPLATGTSLDNESTVHAQALPGDENFVAGIYRDLLGRAPDPIGLDFYTEMLNNGSPPADIVDSIWESAEHRGMQIDGFYQTFLNRPADPDGRQFYVDSMIGGMSEEAAMASFLASAEFQQLNPVPGQFVESLYNDLLNRAPDQQGLAFWITQLQSNIETPAEVAQAFLDSNERHQVLVTSYYSQYLMRAPDENGLVYFTEQLDLGLMDERSVAEVFLSSTEYVNLYPLP